MTDSQSVYNIYQGKMQCASLFLGIVTCSDFLFHIVSLRSLHDCVREVRTVWPSHYVILFCRENCTNVKAKVHMQTVSNYVDFME